MTPATNLSIQPEMWKKLSWIASLTQRTELSLAEEAIKEYITIQEDQLSAIQEGIKEADQGKLLKHEDLKKKWESKLGNSMD